MDGALDKIPDRTVFHRDIARRSHEVRLREPQCRHLGIVLLEADKGPQELGLVRPFWHDETQRQRVMDLLQNEVWEDGKNLGGDSVAEFILELEHAGVGELEIAALRRDARIE